MIEVFDLRHMMKYFDEAVNVVWNQWGSQSNFENTSEYSPVKKHP